MWVDWLRRRWRSGDLGRQGEAAAARYLRKLGYKIVAQGQRSRIGELDLVAVDPGTAVGGSAGDRRTVVFVEVKTRKSHAAGHPAEAVDVEKQRRLTQAALGFLKHHGLLEHRTRFDVVAITWPEGRRQPQVEHIRGAFEAVGRGQMFR